MKRIKHHVVLLALAENKKKKNKSKVCNVAVDTD